MRDFADTAGLISQLDFGDCGGYVIGASGGGDGQAGVDAAAVCAGLAVDAGAGGFAVVSDDAVVSEGGEG